MPDDGFSASTDSMTDTFEHEVQAYTRADTLGSPPSDCVLFYGGSSVRFWPLLEYDFPEHPVLNRGFGGARTKDCIRLFHRLVEPYAPRIIILYAGDNDIIDGSTPEHIIDDLRVFVELASVHFSSIKIGLLSVKPSPARQAHWSQIRKLNDLIRALASTRANLEYLNIYDAMVSHSGPIEHLFLEDGLHMDRAGYDIWRDVVARYLAVAYSNPATPKTTHKEAGLRREHHEWFSPYLSRKMELLVYGEAGPQILSFPTLRGRFYQFESHGIVEALRNRLDSGAVQLICLDSVDLSTLYNSSLEPKERIEHYIHFQHYILREVLPFLHRINRESAVTLLGCSLGAFHAINIGFRHPHLFKGIVALSGRYDLTKYLNHAFRDLFDGFYDDDIYFNTPLHFLQNLDDPTLLHRMRQLKITLSVGEQDCFFDSTRSLSEALWRKGIMHGFQRWPGGAHDFHHWREMIKLYS